MIYCCASKHSLINVNFITGTWSNQMVQSNLFPKTTIKKKKKCNNKYINCREGKGFKNLRVKRKRKSRKIQVCPRGRERKGKSSALPLRVSLIRRSHCRNDRPRIVSPTYQSLSPFKIILFFSL